MEHLELLIFGLLVAIAALTYAARTLDIPYPILLVIGGCALGFVPGLPDVELDPDLVLLIFLPPLLFHAAYYVSLRDMRQLIRPIALNAVGLVLFTMALVAVVLHAAVPGLPWAAAFALGAAVAPTDPIAASAVARRLGVPRNLLAGIEGESLVNDGTALVAYRTAVAAAVGGSFDLLDATGDFVVNAVGGIAIGLVAGWIAVRVFRRVIDDTTLAITISLVCAYAAYLPAEELHVSGVLAVVTTGLVMGLRWPEVSSAESRITGAAFWDIFVYLLNALLFVLVGLQLPGIVENQDRSAWELVGLGAVVSVAVIGTRLLWLNTMPYLIRALDRRPSQRARRVGWRARMIVAWSGMRGAVTLAAILALPETIEGGAPFPERDLLIFLAFCVILATLVLQGLTLPHVIRWAGVADDGGAEREEMQARNAAAEAALVRLEELREEEWTRDDTIERSIGLYRFRQRRIAQRMAEQLDGEEENLDERSIAYQRLVREVIEAQRHAVVALRNDGTISDEIMHVIERELDLEEQRLEI